MHDQRIVGRYILPPVMRATLVMFALNLRLTNDISVKELEAI